MEVLKPLRKDHFYHFKAELFFWLEILAQVPELKFIKIGSGAEFWLRDIITPPRENASGNFHICCVEKKHRREFEIPALATL